MARIIFTTCEKWSSISISDKLVADELTALGHDVESVPWNGDFGRFISSDLVLLCSNWDYHYHIQEFRKWLGKLKEHDIPLQNSLEIIKWNLSKSYISELAKNGILTPKSMIVDSKEDLEASFEKMHWSKAVVKPIYGASGHLVECISREEIPNWAMTHIEKGANKWLLQEFISEIEQSGELSIVFINGNYSHAVRKIPKQGEFRINGQYGGQTSRIEPTSAIVEVARNILDYLEEIPLYARVDGVSINDTEFCLLELELNEPGLFFDLAPEKALYFARAIENSL